MDQKRLLSILWDYALVSIGTLLYCLAWTSFLIPGGIASGGATGLSTILFFATGIPVAYSFFVLNVFFLAAGFLVLGKSFGVKTIYVIILSTLLFDILPRLGLEIQFEDRLITAIAGGLVEAIGIGIVLMRGGSTGGTDILAMIVNKYWPVSPGKVYLYTDMFIIASVLLVPDKTVNDMVYGFVTMVTFSFTVDSVLLGNKSSVQILIFSSRYEEIADYILKNIHRGVTAIDATGWYSGKETKVLLVVCRKSQLHDIASAVKEIDSKAFVSVSSATDVYGEGFEEMKTGVKLKKTDMKNVKKTDTKKETASPEY